MSVSTEARAKVGVSGGHAGPAAAALHSRGVALVSRTLRLQQTGMIHLAQQNFGKTMNKVCKLHNQTLEMFDLNVELTMLLLLSLYVVVIHA